jgi:hypothetical protein
VASEYLCVDVRREVSERKIVRVGLAPLTSDSDSNCGWQTDECPDWFRSADSRAHGRFDESTILMCLFRLVVTYVDILRRMEGSRRNMKTKGE